MNYHDFDLEAIDYRVDDGVESFSVRVIASPAGEQRDSEAERVVVPERLRMRLMELEVPDLPLEVLIGLGEGLAELLFPPGVRKLLLRSRDLLDEDEGLRVRLRLNAWDLTDLPWEYLYLPLEATTASARGLDGFLALDRRTSLVRYEVLGQPVGTLQPLSASSVRVVALLASPHDAEFDSLDLDVESRAIDRALSKVPALRVQFFPRATSDVLVAALLEQAHVFHFAGHGGFNLAAGGNGGGFVVLEREDGGAARLSAEVLALNLRDSGVRLAVLAACEGGRRNGMNAWNGVAPALARAGIPAIVAMQYSIFDEDATAFSGMLYERLAAGQPIDAAVMFGRRALLNRAQVPGADNTASLLGTAWGVPVLYLRSATGVLFPRAPVIAEDTSWPRLVERTRAQTERILREIQGTAARRGAYIPEVYVPRPAIEDQLDAFLAGAQSAAILIGAAGSGKTSLLCQFACKLLDLGHGVFFYDGARVILDVERLISTDLALADSSLQSALARISDLAASRDRRFVILFDAINEFRGDQGSGPRHLLRRIDALVAQLPANVRVVLSCSTASWRQLERTQPLALHWSRYFPADTPTPLLEIDRFTPEELQRAYEHYREFFHLQSEYAELPATLRERLREPLLLRLEAELYRDRPEDLRSVDLALGILRRYYDERVTRLRDQRFAEAVAAAMLKERRSTLALDVLLRDSELRAEILSDDTDSSYNRLRDIGLLTELATDALRGEVIRFSHVDVGAYVLARHLLHTGPLDAIAIGGLVSDSADFALGWSAARAILLLQPPDTLLALAQSSDVELRELVAEAIVQLHSDEPARALALIQQLLGIEREEARRTGLKAAYRIGAGAREVFISAALRGEPTLRRAVKDTLYLLWRSDAEFVQQLLQELSSNITLHKLPVARRALLFIVELSVTIYINHCDRPAVAQQTSDLWQDILRNRLYMHLWNRGIFGPAFKEIAAQVVSRGLAAEILGAMSLRKGQSETAALGSGPVDRAGYQRTIGLLEPDADLTNAGTDLGRLLHTEHVGCNLLASLVLAIHAYRDFPRTEPLLRELFDQHELHGRLWQLLAFTVLLPDTPSAWTPLLEEQTRTLIESHPAVFYAKDANLPDGFDVLLLPLGLSYAKHGVPMAYIEEGIREAARTGTQEQRARWLSALGAIGFYHPERVLETIRNAMPDVRDPIAQQSLVPPLATMRTLHQDMVDIFLNQIGASDEIRRDIAGLSDVALVQRYIYTIGIYNNAVHQAAYYPLMRRNLLMAGFEMLANSERPRDFTSQFTKVAMRMTREADYELIRWTRPE